MGAYELTFEEETGDFVADKRWGGCSRVSECKVGSEVGGHMASGYGWLGRWVMGGFCVILS